MKWDESKHPRDIKGRFSKYSDLSVEELKDVVTVKVYETDTATHVTPITDQAIQRVPVMNIPGYTEDDCKYIADQCKELLEYARDNNNHNEVAFVYRDNFKDKKLIKGTDDSIDFGYALDGLGNKIVILHNHPRNHTFSFDDLTTFVSLDEIKTMVIVKNNGNVEVITKPLEFNRQRFYNGLTRCLSKIGKTNSVKYIEKVIKDMLMKGVGAVIWKKSE